MQADHEHRVFREVRFGVDKRGIVFYTGLYPEGYRRRISMTNALYNSTATPEGIKFSEGYMLPYGEIDPLETAKSLYTGERLHRLLGSETPKRPVFVIYKNVYYQRVYFDHPPEVPYTPIAEYGITVTWHIESESRVFQHDIRMRERGKGPLIDELFYRMMKLFSYEIYGNSDEVVYVNGNVGLLDSFVKGSNLITTKPARVIIDQLRYFKDSELVYLWRKGEAKSSSVKYPKK